MDKTKIDWCDSTWNPVTGCLHGCKYCYARGIANRFSSGGDRWTDDKIVVLNEKICGEEDEKALAYPYGFKPTFYRYRLNEYRDKKKPRNIFVCSMADLFGEWVPDKWIEEVFKACDSAPQHNYMFLTKNPGRYVKLAEKGILRCSNNMWYGWSQTRNEEYKMFSLPCPHTFVSVEPIQEPIRVPLDEWVIVGAETGRRKNKVVPERWWIEQIVEDCEKFGIPLFMKSSLADIWGEPLIQELPKQLVL